MKLIGANHGAEVLRLRLQEIDPGEAQWAYDTVFGNPGQEYPNNRPNAKAAGTLRTLVADHDELVAADVIGRIERLEARANRIPFPFGASS